MALYTIPYKLIVVNHKYVMLTTIFKNISFCFNSFLFAKIQKTRYHLKALVMKINYYSSKFHKFLICKKHKAILDIYFHKFHGIGIRLHNLIVQLLYIKSY